MIKPATTLRCRRNRMWMIESKPVIPGPGCSRGTKLQDYSKRLTISHLTMKPKHIALPVTCDVWWGTLALRRLGRSNKQFTEAEMGVWSAGQQGLTVLRRWAERPINSSDGDRILTFLCWVMSGVWWGCLFWERLIWRAELQQLALETAKTKICGGCWAKRLTLFPV